MAGVFHRLVARAPGGDNISVTVAERFRRSNQAAASRIDINIFYVRVLLDFPAADNFMKNSRLGDGYILGVSRDFLFRFEIRLFPDGEF